ncbi:MULTISPECIES: HIT family protein [unclassified Luteococcus]|uniref:HIT family protein n=1 Tax=unclassified Luteococcus TaxID=2639923 RepID=UPI00313CD791
MDCLFCSIVSGDLPSRKVYEDDHSYAFLDIAPFHKGHTLVVPKRHVDDLTGDAEVLAEIAPAVSHVSRLLVDKLDADGLNMLSSAGPVAGQEVFHLHVHLVPRYGENPGLAALLQKDDAEDLDEVLAQILS